MPRKRTSPVEQELLALEAFEILQSQDQNRHMYALLKRILEMSTTEAEAITNLQAGVAAIAPALTDLTTAVGQVIVAAGDNPVKVAALDNVTTNLADVTTKLTGLTTTINAALVPPTPPTP